MPASIWIWQKATIKQHNRYIGSFKGENDSLIRLVALGTPLERRKEHSGHFLTNILLAKLPSLVRLGLGIRCQITPEQSVFGRLRSLGHTLPDRTKNLGIGNVGEQQPEQQTILISRAGSHVRA